MAVTAFATNTQTATIGVEHSLASCNLAGVYRCRVNTVNMAAGDVLEIRVKSKAIAGGTKRGETVLSYAGVQPTDELIKRTEAVETDLAETDGIEFTLKQTFGTGRNFEFTVTRTA